MDKTALTAIRDSLAAVKAKHDEASTELAGVIQGMSAEIDRDPTVADVQALLNEVVARQKPAA